MPFEINATPKGGIHRGHHLSAGKKRRFGGRRAHCPSGGERVALAPWPAAVPRAAANCISEILPRRSPRWALGRGAWRDDRWLRLQLDDGDVLVFVATLCQAGNPGEGHRPSSAVESLDASRAQPGH